MSRINYSIIIPHKNTPILLNRLLDSIPRRDDLEIIIVDDNSHEELVDFNNFPGIGERNIAVILNKQEGRGAGYARNIGLSKACGKWLLFADADDFYDKNIFWESVDQYRDSLADIVYFGVVGVDSENPQQLINKRGVVQKLDEYYTRYLDGDLSVENDIRYNFTEPWAKMIRRKLVACYSITFDETMVANDYMFSVKVGFHAKRIKVDCRKLYILTYRKGSLSSSFADTSDKLLIRIRVAINVVCFFDKHQIHYDVSPLRGLIIILIKKYPYHIIGVMIEIYKYKINIVRLISDILNRR
jgi:glycosyltransferase involved in cell wall biosynthesis